MNNKKTLDQRLDQYAKVFSESGCRMWDGHRDKDGYGIACMTLSDGKKNRKVHQLVYESVYGKIPNGLFVCHACDTPSCVNIDHLFLGTAKENNHDMIGKGRQKYGKQNNNGARNPMARLTAESVLLMRNLYAGGATLSGLCERFNISRSHAHKIVKKVSWSHI